MKRTDWIEYDPDDKTTFQPKIEQALREIDSYLDLESDLLEAALKARNPDCAIAFERANKAFLLSGGQRFIEAARKLLEKIAISPEPEGIADLDRLRQEIETFILQADRAVAAIEAQPNARKRMKSKDISMSPTVAS